jgi:signal transduction histidine kinase
MTFHVLFGIYVISYFSWAYFIVFKKLLKANGVLRAQLGYIFVGTLSSTTITLITNMGLLYFGNFSFNWLGQIGIIIMITLIFYSILKFRLFNIKVITTELFVFALWIFLLVKFFLSDTTQDKIINAVLFLLVVLVGMLLIKSIIKEIKTREKIEKLATDLSKANTRLLELDKQKSEFVSFATHQLRAPLTAMKGYASLILEGDLGTLNKEVREAIGRIFDSSKTLANIVDSYLNISRIELGTMKYSFEVLNMKEMVENVIGELKPNIEKSGLKFTFSTIPTNPQERFMISADRDKFKQVVMNLIDNSIKYTPSGSLTVTLSKDTTIRKVIFTVKDTGVGISPEVMPKLFMKFTRAENANKQNIYGTGLGLFVAKEIVTAHKGRIWAESDGDGKGSTFFLEMDMEV